MPDEPADIGDARNLAGALHKTATRAHHYGHPSGPATRADLARTFAKVRAPKVEAILLTLTALGRARQAPAGGYVATA